MYCCDPMNLKDNHPWVKIHLCVLKDACQFKVFKLIINKGYRILWEKVYLFTQSECSSQ